MVIGITMTTDHEDHYVRGHGVNFVVAPGT
jgi:hypothetical protein